MLSACAPPAARRPIFLFALAGNVTRPFAGSFSICRMLSADS